MTQTKFRVSAETELKIDSLWCERHGRSNKFRTQAAVAYITSRLANKVLETQEGPMTRSEVIDRLHELAPLCCYLGDQDTFSVCMVAGMQLRGVMYLSPTMLEILKERRR